MRVLVAGRNAAVLAKAAGTFTNDLQISTAASKADCFALLANSDFDLIIACETLADGPGLEVLSHVVVNTPNTLRIFAARPATLDLLKGELGFFGLFRTMPYPINFRKLWAAISLAQGVCDGQAPVPVPVPAPAPAPSIRHVVLEDTWEVETLSALAPQQQQPAPQQHRPAPQEQVPPQQQPGLAPQPHPPAQQQQGLAPQPHPPTQQQQGLAPQPHPPTQQQQGLAPQPYPPTQQQSRTEPQPPIQPHEVPPGMRAAARYAEAHAARDPATAPARIPESEAFKRARARRDAANLNAANRDSANRSATTRDTANRDAGDRHTANRNNRDARKREPVISTHALAELAKRFATQRPLAQFVRAPTGIKRAVLLIGSGVFAAITLAALTFFMVNANESTKPAKISMIASVNQPLPHKAFPWQPETQQPTRQASSMGSEASPTAVAEFEAKAEAAPETPNDGGDQPVRPPDVLPQLSEPQSRESPGQPANQ
jgi:hypothetical protein